MDSNNILESICVILSIVFVAVLFTAIVWWIVVTLQKIFCAIKRIDTKRKKLIILWTGTFIIVIMCFFPPFITDKGAVVYNHLFSDKVEIVDHGYSMSSHPVPAHIYFVRLIVQSAIVALITGVLFFTIGNSLYSSTIIYNKKIDKINTESKLSNNFDLKMDYNLFIKGWKKLKIGNLAEEVLLFVGNPTINQKCKGGMDKWTYEKQKDGIWSSIIYSFTVIIFDNKVVELIPDCDWVESK